MTRGIRSMKWTAVRMAVAALALLLLARQGVALAQSIELYKDAKGQVFTEPGPGRHLLATIPAALLAPEALEKKVEQHTEMQLQQNQQQIEKLVEQNQQLEYSNDQLQRQVADIQPAWRDYINNLQSKFRMGTLVYGDYRFYTHTGYGPQEMTEINAPGPGNNTFNSFNITRAYLNLFFFPTDDWTIRVTPNVYTTIGGPCTAVSTTTLSNTAGAGGKPSASTSTKCTTNDPIGRTSAYAQTLDGNMGFRLKYAYAQYSKLWDWSPNLKGGTITAGMVPNPLVDWEEQLYGYRYVNLTPWNYISLSSTQIGVSAQGPIRIGEKQYFDYDFGAYTDASFHAFDQASTKQAMWRFTYYPFGAKWRYDGLGATIFQDYGYGNVTPDTTAATKKNQQTRWAALLHYSAEQYGLAVEYDWGHNAFSGNNLFSSSGPSDFFGIPSGQPCSGKNPHTGVTVARPCLSDWSNMVTAMQNFNTKNRAWDVFGHVHIPYTPLTAFGMFQWWQPNVNVSHNPLDFMRWIAGVSWQYNEYLRFSLNSQNLLYYHKNFDVSKFYINNRLAPGTFPNFKTAGFASRKAYATCGTTGPLFNNTPNCSVLDSVTRDNHSIWLNMEFSY
jgi:cell division protein FtsB